METEYIAKIVCVIVSVVFVIAAVMSVAAHMPLTLRLPKKKSKKDQITKADIINILSYFGEDRMRDVGPDALMSLAVILKETGTEYYIKVHSEESPSGGTSLESYLDAYYKMSRCVSVWAADIRVTSGEEPYEFLWELRDKLDHTEQNENALAEIRTKLIVEKARKSLEALKS